MTITTTGTAPATAPPLSALRKYERLIAFSGVTHVAWQALANDLRAEAESLTGAQRRKRIDRALICESKALAQRTAAAFHAELAGAA